MEYEKWYKHYCHQCGYGTNYRDRNCRKCNKYMFIYDYL